MRLFIAALVLIFGFQSWTKADDISEFEIEGMSVGDSLLDYFSDQEIKKNIKWHYWERINDKTFILSEIKGSNNFNNYEFIQFVFKRSDTKYKLYGIHGIIWYENDIASCKNKIKEISSEINNSINYEDNYDWNDLEISGERGKYSGVTYYLKKGIISIHCTDWSKKIEEEKNWVDHLSVNIKTNEYENFLNKD